MTAVPPGMQYSFWFTTSLGSSSSNGLHMEFPTIIALITQVKKLMCGFCQLLSIFISIMYSRNGGEKTTGWVQQLSESTVF